MLKHTAYTIQNHFNVQNDKRLQKCWIVQKLPWGFSVPAYGKLQTNFLANPINPNQETSKQ